MLTLKNKDFTRDTVGSKDKKRNLYEDRFHDLLSAIGKEEVTAVSKDRIEKRLRVCELN